MQPLFIGAVNFVFRNELKLNLTTHIPNFTCFGQKLIKSDYKPPSDISGLHQAYYSVEIVTQVNFDKIIDRIYLLFTSTFFPRHLDQPWPKIALIPVCYQWPAIKGKKGFHWHRFLKEEEACLNIWSWRRKTKYDLKYTKTNRFYTKKRLWSRVTCHFSHVSAPQSPKDWLLNGWG